MRKVNQVGMWEGVCGFLVLGGDRFLRSHSQRSCRGLLGRDAVCTSREMVNKGGRYQNPNPFHPWIKNISSYQTNIQQTTMAKHHPDLVMCRKQPGIAIGRLCEKCDGKCVICDSFVNPKDIVHICDECNYGSFEGRCVVCGGVGVTDAYYCSKFLCRFN